MSHNKSWQKSPKAFAELAIEAIRMLVAMRRETGWKTCASLEVDALALRTQPRRMRRLFERDRDPDVTFDECDRIVTGVVRVRRAIAERVRDRMDEMDEQTDALALRHRQLTLWGRGEWGKSNGSEDELPGQAA